MKLKWCQIAILHLVPFVIRTTPFLIKFINPHKFTVELSETEKKNYNLKLSKAKLKLIIS